MKTPRPDIIAVYHTNLGRINAKPGQCWYETLHRWELLEVNGLKVIFSLKKKHVTSTRSYERPGRNKEGKE